MQRTSALFSLHSARPYRSDMGIAEYIFYLLFYSTTPADHRDLIRFVSVLGRPLRSPFNLLVQRLRSRYHVVVPIIDKHGSRRMSGARSAENPMTTCLPTAPCVPHTYRRGHFARISPPTPNQWKRTPLIYPAQSQLGSVQSSPAASLATRAPLMLPFLLSSAPWQKWNPLGARK